MDFMNIQLDCHMRIESRMRFVPESLHVFERVSSSELSLHAASFAFMYQLLQHRDCSSTISSCRFACTPPLAFVVLRSQKSPF